MQLMKVHARPALGQAAPDWGALGYAAILLAAGVLGGTAVGAGFGLLTKGKPSTQDFVTGALTGTGVGVGVLVSQAIRGRIL